MALTEPTYGDLTLRVGTSLNADPEAFTLMRKLLRRLSTVEMEQQNFREWCDRADGMYFPPEITHGGADAWPDDPSAVTAGRSHVSINEFKVYVDVPASLQGQVPIENMLATDVTPSARKAAAAMERIFTSWKAEDRFELKFHKACTIKALYGRTAAKVYYDRDEKRPCVEVVEQPRNLYMGYRSDSFEEVEWAAYVQRMSPDQVEDEFGVEVDATVVGDVTYPYISGSVQGFMRSPERPWLDWPGNTRIEVWDYWFRERGANGKWDTYNVVFAGNVVVRGPLKYREYKGDIPYIPLFNTFIPGVPNGDPELRDMEQLIRENMERVTAGSQMIAAGTAGDFWQLTGPDAPLRMPEGFKPVRNKVIYPGAGNRVETITPFIAQFQLEQFLGRIDRSKAIVSGLNDLLLGLAPAQVLSSSKAINALIANYEARLAMRRGLLYDWRRRTWEMVVQVWAPRDATIRQLVKQGSGRLEIIDPSLSPRDELETATKAVNLVNAKLWSQRRGMDAVGVDDPETEQDMIREERTDASLFPQDVQVEVQLIAALQSLGIGAPSNVQQDAQQQMASGQNDLRTALSGAIPQNSPSSQLPGDQGITPPEALTPGAPLPFAQGPQGQSAGATPQGLAQTRIEAGKAKSRILTQQQLGR